MLHPELTVRLDRSSVLSLIGNTPLLRLGNISTAAIDASVELHAKAEWFNPGGSVKDRAASRMILEGERSGQLSNDRVIIDATSGNTGIAYAMIGAALGYPVKLALPANASEERKRLLAAYGAEVILTDPLEGTDGARRVVRNIVDNDPDTYFFPDQYNNPENWQAHYETTAPEIYHQTRGRITHFVAGLGTTGTFVGVSRRLKELNPRIRCIAVQPDSPMHGLEGLKHLPTAVVPGIFDPKLVDEQIEISTDEAHGLVRQLAAEEGLLVGPSSGAALAAALKAARGLAGAVVVTIFPDSGMKYLSEPFWREL